MNSLAQVRTSGIARRLGKTCSHIIPFQWVEMEHIWDNGFFRGVLPVFSKTHSLLAVYLCNDEAGVCYNSTRKEGTTDVTITSRQAGR